MGHGRERATPWRMSAWTRPWTDVGMILRRELRDSVLKTAA